MRGDRLKALREAAGFTQQELAEYLGISEPQVWRYEKGENAPKADVVVKVAKLFNVSTDYLLGMSDELGIQISNDLSLKERAVIAAWRRGERFEAMKVIANDD